MIDDYIIVTAIVQNSAGLLEISQFQFFLPKQDLKECLMKSLPDPSLFIDMIDFPS